MEKFDSKKYSDLANSLPFSYSSTDVYLDFSAQILERNGEKLIVQQDILFPNDFPSLFLPNKKENWINASILLATEEDKKKIKDEDLEILVEKKVGTEFFYNTTDFIDPKGDLKKKVNSFINNYSFEIKNNYSKDKILEFYNFWKNQREHESITFESSEEFFIFCLENLDKYEIKQVYVEIDGKLVGFAWGINFRDGWVGLHLKVNYEYKGLSRFLHFKRAELFKDAKIFSIGTGSHDIGIENYKKELGPIKIIEYSYLLTGQKNV